MNDSQKRAVEKHRRRLQERGLARYEVRGLASDKELVRLLAKRLANNDAAADRLRRDVAREFSEPTRFPPRTGPRTGQDIWDALRRSPMVGVDLDLTREIVPERDIEM